jgi:hypothetical protein
MFNFYVSSGLFSIERNTTSTFEIDLHYNNHDDAPFPRLPWHGPKTGGVVPWTAIHHCGLWQPILRTQSQVTTVEDWQPQIIFGNDGVVCGESDIELGRTDIDKN